MRQLKTVTVAPSSPSGSLSSDGDVTELVDASSGLRHRVRFPQTDIDACVRFSLLRCIVSLFGFALVLTDIPRTGLTVTLEGIYKRAAPSVYWAYGPYVYPTIHINRSISTPHEYRGTKKGKAVSSATVWAYKFDTLSISQRGLAEKLDVPTHPSCILYREPCVGTTLSLETTFDMIDGLVSTMQTKLFSHPTTDRDQPPASYSFLTRSNWLDRLHHILLKSLWRRQDTRLHTVHFFSSDRNISSSDYWRVCPEPTTSSSPLPFLNRRRQTLRPFVCDLYIHWQPKHPFPPPPPLPAPPPVSVPTHIELRLMALQRQYPDLQLDLTMITTRSILSSETFQSRLPIVFYSMENIEVTTWIRGRKCAPKCETVFVDDYRYEGGTLTTDADNWRVVTSSLRATAQGYIWVRFCFLCVGTFRARSREPKLQNRSVLARAWVTFLTISRIPSHVIVYGSWLPVCCYTAAHVIDSGITHLISNNVWASTDGLFAFHFVDYVKTASVQMRNVWMIAFVWKAVMLAYTNGHAKSRGDAWAPRHGVLAVRGVFISLISWFTVLSFVRALRFRDTNIIEVLDLPRHVPFNGLRFPLNYTNVADFGYRLDVKTTATVTILFGVVGHALQYFVRVTTRRRTRYFFCRSYYVPQTAGRLWPRDMLNVFWSMRLRRTAPRTASSIVSIRRASNPHQALKHTSFHLISSSILPIVPPRHASCSVCSRTLSPIHWRGVQGCIRHDHIFRPETRSKEIWSMIRLINVAFLTDPMVLLNAYLYGNMLYLYRSDKRTASYSTVRSGPAFADTVSFAYLLPHQPSELRAAAGTNASHLECAGCVNLRDVPWHALVNCG